MATTRQHAGAPSSGPPIPEPSHAERARTLLYVERIGSLSTQSRKQPGFPFGSLMPFAIDGGRQTVFLISTMAMHTQNLVADPHASLLVTQPDASGDPLGAARVTVIGTVETVPAGEIVSVREIYLSRYENSRYWVDFKDFSFYRMQVVDVYYVGGFGVMGWVSAQEYAEAPARSAGRSCRRHSQPHERRSSRRPDPAQSNCGRNRSGAGNYDSRRPPRISCASQDGRGHAWCSHSIPAGSRQSGRGQKSSGGDGAAGANILGCLSSAVCSTGTLRPHGILERIPS